MPEKDLLNEVWKQIEGYPNYEVSNLGNVRSLNYNGTGTVQILKQRCTPKGYSSVCLYNNGKRKNCLVHRLVWEAFCGKIPEGLHTDHISGDKSNNFLSNLRVVSPKENTHNPITYNRYLEAMKKMHQLPEYREKHVNALRKYNSKYNNKSVVQLDKNTGEVIRRWDCIADVEREIGIHSQSISACCNGRQHYKTAGGYRWIFFTPPSVVYVPEFMKYFES